MKDDWTLYCFGDEEIKYGMDGVPGGYLYLNDDIGKLSKTGYIFGESWNLAECRYAVKECRIFSFRIRYEPK